MHSYCASASFGWIHTPLASAALTRLQEKGQVTIDWSRYVDEDEEKEGFDTSSMGPGAMNFGGGDDMDFGGEPARCNDGWACETLSGLGTPCGRKKLTL